MKVKHIIDCVRTVGRREYMKGYADACDEMIRRAYKHGKRDGFENGLDVGMKGAKILKPESAMRE